MNIIVTDCKEEKLLALKSAGRNHFGTSGLRVVSVEKKEFDTPLSYLNLEKRAAERIAYIQSCFDKTKYAKDDIYYATLQKGFVESYHKTWGLEAYALLRKEEGEWFPGTGGRISIPSELSPFMLLTATERYQKFYETFPELETKSLSSFCADIDEGEWFKRAFNGCIKTATRK